MISRDRLEVILESISKGEKISNVRNRLEMIFSAIAEKIGEGGGGEPPVTNAVIDITAGTGTNSREFTFEKAPKFIGIAYTSGTGTKSINTTIVPKVGNVPYTAMWLDTDATGSVSTGNILSGYVTFSSDLKTMTTHASSADVAFNGSGNAGGKMFVEY